MMMKKVVVGVSVVVALVVFFLTVGRPMLDPIQLRILGLKTVGHIVHEYGDAVDARLEPVFDTAHISYPPDELALLVFKEERILELWGLEDDQWVRVHKYKILGASGHVGPKLQRGDNQVPEGIYAIAALHPNSRFHLSIKINYPNEFDREKAALDGRDDLGDNIFIHGNAVSAGCVAMGNEAIEELFVLVARAGKRNAQVIITPYDMRSARRELTMDSDPVWLNELYASIEKALEPFSLEVSTRR